MHATMADDDQHSPSLARGVASGARLRSRPLVFDRAQGATVWTTDGTPLTDYMLGMGPMLLGHGDSHVLARVSEQLGRGVLYGTTKLELELADRLSAMLPHAERVAFVSSGSEGTHLAIRIARASTGRRLIVKFEGQYHGWLDPLFVNTQNTGAAPRGTVTVPAIHAVVGQTPSDDVVVTRWNDADAISALFAERGDEIAGVILEPLPMNFGTMLPDADYPAVLRDLCTRFGSLLIFDEVLSGFRVALGGATEMLGVQPDLAIYAKAIASGFPLAAVVGTEAAMQSIVAGPVQPAGTYSGNPISVAAALATLDVLTSRGPGLYADLDRIGTRLRDGIRAHRATHPQLEVNQIGSVLQLFWGTGPVASFETATTSDKGRIARLSEAQERYGSLVSPRGLILLSAAHRDDEIDALADGIGRCLKEIE